MSDEATEPELALEPEAKPEVAPEAEAVEETEPQTEGEEESTEPTTWEVEKDGQKYVVPLALKDEIMWHMDYTEKTQQLAEQRRQAEETLGSEREAFYQQSQVQRQHTALCGKLANVEEQLDQLSKIDFAKIHQEDPDQAQQLGFHRESLRDQRDNLQDEIERQVYESRVNAEREHADRKDRLETDLARDIPNYTPELKTEMTQTAVRHGFTEKEIGSITDARYMRVLHLAHLGEQVLKRQTATKPAKPVKPVPKVTGGKTPSQGPTDKDSTAAWMERRTQQLKRRA